MAQASGYNVAIIFFSIVGAAISSYAYFVETTKEKNPDYQAVCDINEIINCSNVFASAYGKGFGIVKHLVGEKHILNQPNSAYGVIFYLLFALLSVPNSISLSKVQVFLAILANISSLYLGYILYFVLHNLCILCIATYVVNLIILILALLKTRRPGKKQGKSKPEKKQNKNAPKNKNAGNKNASKKTK